MTDSGVLERGAAPGSAGVAWLRCHARPITLTLLGLGIAGTFWFGSRYPALLAKLRQVGDVLPSMAYNHELFPARTRDAAWVRIATGALNWLNAMWVGMTFGVLFGALLHTVLRYHPLRVGRNYTLNALQGAFLGAPMGVCANCAVPMACGVTRGHGRVEVALGYLFSSPTFNPVVVAMTFSVLPARFGVVKYLLAGGLIAGVVPRLIGFLEARGGLAPRRAALVADGAGPVDMAPEPCATPFGETVGEVLRAYAGHVWMLVKPTVVLMLGASVAASALLVLVPWGRLLATTGVGALALASVLGVAMPVPIALDVMFAAQLYVKGTNPGYVILFLTTLGTYSIIPAVYLWREVSPALAVTLFAFFAVTGLLLGLVFAALA